MPLIITGVSGFDPLEVSLVILRAAISILDAELLPSSVYCSSVITHFNLVFYSSSVVTLRSRDVILS